MQAWWEDLKNLSFAEIIENYGKLLAGVFIAFVLLAAGVIYLAFDRVLDPAGQAPVSATALVESDDQEENSQSESSMTDQAEAGQDSNSESQVDELIYVDVKGAVKSPGLYQVQAGDRVLDAIDLAGGLNDQADSKRINLSQRLQDQMVVYVPALDEEVGAKDLIAITPVLSGDGPTAGSSQGDSQKININTADASQLQEISGIGEKKAADIIQYRESKGSFQTIEEITEVSGIGDKTFEKIKEQITVN
ncbi:helix-hairpin-helix domain-containing protein [Aerococcus urinae]|uniref:helix-hairpin-helix domain-containing protein n=1 Tax=Aerococcus urinae TaxID=1376 RepID=UPI002550EAC6|nr:helix-hairpin-helix domain-containing protein [Aerococcus urinae]MDK6651529.1 helix-hairpin-helix domain-containing protein [Aerococcus urinae]